MKLSLFGKQIFDFRTDGRKVLFNSLSLMEKSKFLLDFYTMQERGGRYEFDPSSYISIADSQSSGITFEEKISDLKKPKKKKKPTVTPKGAYELKLLNDESFKIKVGKKYVEEQIEDFKEKLEMMTSSEYDVDRGTKEVASILMRFQNRIKYKEHSKFFDEYPYTSTRRMIDLVEKHDNLKIDKVEEFLADMPKEAMNEMKAYTRETKKLCKKKPIFYIIADKKDFEKTHKRKDPILLAQSPFGHFWQILGAWDEEMLFLDEL